MPRLARWASVAGAAQEQERHECVEAEILAQPWTPVTITVDGVPVEFRHTSYGERWAAISRIDQTTITIVCHGRSSGEVTLATVTDLAPHVEYAQRREREHIEQRLAEHGISWEQYRPTRSPADKARRAAVRRVVDDLTNALHRNAGAPDLASLFTEGVIGRWGDRDRYQQLLWLHTMLRPITGAGSTGDYPQFRDDGSADMRISLNHAAPSARGSDSFVILRATGRAVQARWAMPAAGSAPTEIVRSACPPWVVRRSDGTGTRWTCSLVHVALEADVNGPPRGHGDGGMGLTPER